MNTIYKDNALKNVSKTFVIKQRHNTRHRYKNALKRLETCLKSILITTATNI